ncbi:MAG: hypothetical protein K2W99_01395 [Chthoniobacterales bacterium]|nr:hypothetical protein [Chthoniobacterales bacterium]
MNKNQNNPHRGSNFLDEKNDTLSLKTLVKAASALGKTLKIELVTA